MAQNSKATKKYATKELPFIPVPQLPSSTPYEAAKVSAFW